MLLIGCLVGPSLWALLSACCSLRSPGFGVHSLNDVIATAKEAAEKRINDSTQGIKELTQKELPNARKQLADAQKQLSEAQNQALHVQQAQKKSQDKLDRAQTKVLVELQAASKQATELKREGAESIGA
jgi:hypothetical protein